MMVVLGRVALLPIVFLLPAAMITVLVKAFGSSGVVPPFVAAWIPVVVAMFLGSTILLHQEDG